MRTSTHFELNLVEGADKVNPLVQDVPNYETIDDAMYDNKRSSIGIATELRTGTVHALTRQNEDAPMFRFTASSNYAIGDTFTVDGVQVSALLVDGTPLPNMAYIIGSEVLCVLKGTLMTVFANRTTASDADKLGGELPSYYATDSDLDALEGVVNAHTNQISQLTTNLGANVGTVNTSGASAQGSNYTQSVTIPKGGLYLCTITHEIQQGANGLFTFSVPSVANRVYGGTGCYIVGNNFPIRVGNSFTCIVDTRGLNTDYTLQFVGWSEQGWSTWTNVDYVKIPTN